MKYLFQLGHQPHISTAELSAVFSQTHENIKIIKHENNFLILEVNKKIDSQELIEQLGGTIKIGLQIKNTGDPVKSIVQFLNKHNEGKINFSVAGNNTKEISLTIKKELKAQGRSVRYIEPKNTATILHNNLIEKQGDFTIIGQEVFVTQAIQDIVGFSKRDYERPGSDDKSGMLPPKLARIMINLSQANPKTDTLLDPFCGSGTILTEAFTLDFKNIIGTDKSEKAINDSKKNIEWLKKDYELRVTNYKLIRSDATQLLNHLKPNSIDTIVSEPYLGQPLKGRETIQQLETQARELARLYIESFKSFYKILKKSGVIIFIIPRFKFDDSWIIVDCLEGIKKIGFQLVPFGDNESLLYHRPKQYVGREVWKLRR